VELYKAVASVLYFSYLHQRTC